LEAKVLRTVICASLGIATSKVLVNSDLKVAILNFIGFAK